MQFSCVALMHVSQILIAADDYYDYYYRDDPTDHEGFTPLHAACISGSVECAEVHKWYLYHLSTAIYEYWIMWCASGQVLLDHGVNVEKEVIVV